MRYYLKYLKGDPVIWMIVILLMSFSLVTVYSFVPVLVKIEGGTPFYYLAKHLVYVVLVLDRNFGYTVAFRIFKIIRGIILVIRK